MAKAKPKSDNRADTRGGGWVGIPHVVVDSAAYRHLSLWARAVLIEIAREFNGYNNGIIKLSQREIAERLTTTNYRKISAAVAELMEHGFIDIAVEGTWIDRQARLFRLTFITTGDRNHLRPASNDYRGWMPREKLAGDDVSAETTRPGDDVSAEPKKPADDVSAKIAAFRRKTANSQNAPADDVSSLICKPYPPAQPKGAEGVNGLSEYPETAAADFDVCAADSLATTVRDKLDQHRRHKGLLGLSALARAAGADPQRVIAFVERRDLLTAPTIARLHREIGKAA